MSRTRRRTGRKDPDTEPGNWVDVTDQSCRLLVACPPGLDPAPFLEIDAVAGFILPGEPGAELIAGIRAAGRAAFLVDRPDRVRAVGADGVLLGRPGEVAAARRLLDRGELIGAVVGDTRHDAMVAGEDGADYVLFGTPGKTPADGIENLAAHVTWWTGIAVLPCVVAGRFTIDDVRRLAAAGADFLLPDVDGAAGLAALAAVLPVPER
ncbi:MAG: thiamine phosphate synthase [Geminicoccaceae bacterium]